MLTKTGTAVSNSGGEEGGGRTDWHKRCLHDFRSVEGASKGWLMLSALTTEAEKCG